MKQNDLAVFKLEREGFKLELEAQRPIAPVVAAVPPAAIATQTLPANVTGSGGAAGEEKSKLKEIVSPVVCIIEAMKVMNEIKAEVRGIIVEVLVENGTPVQFGQPLFRVK